MTASSAYLSVIVDICYSCIAPLTLRCFPLISLSLFRTFSLSLISLCWWPSVVAAAAGRWFFTLMLLLMLMLQMLQLQSSTHIHFVTETNCPRLYSYSIICVTYPYWYIYLQTHKVSYNASRACFRNFEIPLKVEVGLVKFRVRVCGDAKWVYWASRQQNASIHLPVLDRPHLYLIPVPPHTGCKQKYGK